MKIICLFSLFYCFLNITGCSSKIDIKPDNLNKAFLNEYYEQIIEIEKINLVGQVIIDTNLPENSGILFSKIGEDEYFYENTIKIHGTPKTAGQYYIELKGYYRGGYAGSSVKFKKKYDFVVMDK